MPDWKANTLTSTPDEQDSIIIPGANYGVEPDQYAGTDDLMPPDTPPLVPHLFTGPVAGLPLAIVCDIFHDENGAGWVAVRIETVHGSTVHFLHPDVADNLALDLADKAPGARISLERTDNGWHQMGNPERPDRPAT